MLEINSQGTEEIVCPYCGDKTEDSSQFEGDSVYHCWECGEDSKLEVDYEVTYYTFKKESSD